MFIWSIGFCCKLLLKGFLASAVQNSLRFGSSFFVYYAPCLIMHNWTNIIIDIDIVYSLLPFLPMLVCSKSFCYIFLFRVIQTSALQIGLMYGSIYLCNLPVSSLITCADDQHVTRRTEV